MDTIKVAGITTTTNVSKIVLKDVEDRPGTAAAIFALLGDTGINVELISQSPSGGGLANISFVVLESEAEAVMDIFRKGRSTLKIRDIIQDPKSSVITVYSDQLRSTSGVVSRMFKALSAVGVNIDIISTSLSGVSVVVSRDRCSEALTALNEIFEVEGVFKERKPVDPGEGSSV